MLLKKRKFVYQHDAEAIEESVAISSEKNRNFFSVTLFAFLFLLIVILQTTDSELLIGKNVHLPIFEIGIPLFAFCIITPLLVLALHFNLLQNIELHFFKLCCWSKLFPSQQVPRLRVFPFVFDIAAFDKKVKFPLITAFVTQLLVFWIGPIILVILLWRFSDYQDLRVTAWHSFLLVFDLYIVCGYINSMLVSKRVLSANSVLGLGKLHLWIAGFFLIGGLLPFALLISLHSTNLDYEQFEFEYADMPEFILPRIKIAAGDGESLVKNDSSLIDLRNRSLKLSDFFNTNLSKSLLNGASLQGSFLYSANLSDANLTSSNLKGAVLVNANLKGTVLDDMKIDKLTDFHEVEVDCATSVYVLESFKTIYREDTIDSDASIKLQNQLYAQGWPKISCEQANP